MVCLFLANGFEEIEAVVPLDILRRAGADVKTVSVGTDRIVRGAHGIEITADMLLSEIQDDIKMIILPGGMPGTDNLEKSNELLSIIKKCHNNGKYIAAICAAPKILGGLGLLNGKKATCYPGFERFLTGAEFTSNEVEVCGGIITSKGPAAAYEFGFTLAQLLDISDVRSIKEGMQYNG